MEEIKSIAVGGSAADPPHLSHFDLLRHLITLERFDLVIWILSGFRKDKNQHSDPNDRVIMTELMIPKIWRTKSGTRLQVRYDDVFKKNTPTILWLKRLQKQYSGAQLTWFTGIDSVVPQRYYGKRCEIEACWEGGRELMRDWNFLIFPRRGFPIPKLPPNFEVVAANLRGTASSHIRDLIRSGQPFEKLLTRKVADYIKLNRLYGYQEPKGANR